MFMGYEWQGAGLDGDHNVFFLNNDGEQRHPMRYQELAAGFKGQPVIGIPHHLAYQPVPEGRTGKLMIRNFLHLQRFIPVMDAAKMMTDR